MRKDCGIRHRQSGPSEGEEPTRASEAHASHARQVTSLGSPSRESVDVASSGLARASSYQETMGIIELASPSDVRRRARSGVETRSIFTFIPASLALGATARRPVDDLGVASALS